MLTRRELDGMQDGLDFACRSIESLVEKLDHLVDNGEIERMMPLVELLESQSLLVYHDYLLMSMEEAESEWGLEGSSG